MSQLDLYFSKASEAMEAAATCYAKDDRMKWLAVANQYLALIRDRQKRAERFGRRPAESTVVRLHAKRRA